MFAPMAPTIFLLVAAVLFAYHPLSLFAQPPNPEASRITILGAVYCDACSTKTFSRHSYFLPGVDVHVQCTFKANSPRTEEQINFSVNRTTDRYGIYKLEIPYVEGVDCVDGSAIESMCQASLIKSSVSACDIPALKTTTDQISIKSRQQNLCIYSFNALSYKPSKLNETLCKNLKQELLPCSFNSSKFFFPYFPPYGFPWPPLPQLPPFPSLPFPPFPPLPSLPFPPLPPFPSYPFPPLPFRAPPPPSLPFPFPPLPSLPFPPSPPFPSFPFPPLPFRAPPPPSLPFPFPPLPPLPPAPSLFHPPPPPAFNLADPRTWIPNFPPFSPPSPPPPPPGFSLKDPRTWIPHPPPSPPVAPQNQNP